MAESLFIELSREFVSLSYLLYEKFRSLKNHAQFCFDYHERYTCDISFNSNKSFSRAYLEDSAINDVFTQSLKIYIYDILNIKIECMRTIFSLIKHIEQYFDYYINRLARSFLC